jgi:hypothetical protein
MDSEERNGLVMNSRQMDKMEIGEAGDEGGFLSGGGSRGGCCDLRLAAILSVVSLLLGVILHSFGNRGDTILTFTCPAIVRDADNFDKESFEEEYVTAQKEATKNTTKFLHDFRNQGYDSWGKTYEQVKAGMLKWKQAHYPPNIQSGGSIYESACGIGLNLYMSLEILEEAGITDLVVYGNEYLPFSTEKANVVFDNAAPAGSKKGTICAADSTDLSYVPSNTFDLVFTGYISPILDPLNFNTGSIDKNYHYYKKLCNVWKQDNHDNTTDDWKDIKLVELAQEKQEKFYGKWIAEMIRIAKPGSAVIVEQVSYPYCEEFYDWGGVNQEWWKPAIDKFGWDIEPDSIIFEQDTIYRHRYHTFMRKKSNADVAV